MNVKGLVLSSYLGILLVAVVTWTLVLTGADGKGGNASVSWFLLCGFIIVFLGFLLCWRQQPRVVVRPVCQYVSSLDEDLTPEEGARLLQRYSPLLLVASLIYLAGSQFALFFY